MLSLLSKGVPTKLLKYFWLKIFFICHRCQRHRWSTLSCEYLRAFSKKFETALLVYSGAWGKLIHEKKQKSKISWHCPFKYDPGTGMVIPDPHFFHPGSGSSMPDPGIKKALNPGSATLVVNVTFVYLALIFVVLVLFCRIITSVSHLQSAFEEARGYSRYHPSRGYWWHFGKVSYPNQCWGSVTFWCGSGSPDPYLWLMDPDPTPDPNPFFIDFKDAKKKFPYFFLITFPLVIIFSLKKINFLRKFCVKTLFCRH